MLAVESGDLHEVSKAAPESRVIASPKKALAVLIDRTDLAVRLQ